MRRFKNRITEKAYNKCDDKCLFNLRETDEALCAFMKKHFPDLKGYSEKENEAIGDITDIFIRERENAFEVGFRTGIKTILEIGFLDDSE